MLVLVRIIFPKLRAAAFFSFQRCARDCFGNGQQILQVERGVPAGVELTMSDNASAIRALPQLLQVLQRSLHFAFVAHDADLVLHHLLQVFLHSVRIFAGALLEWRNRLARYVVDPIMVDFA